MSAARRSGILFLMTAAIALASAAQAANQQYVGSLVINSFGHDGHPATGGLTKAFSAFGIPMGNQCNPGAPICALASTPVTTGAMTMFQGNPVFPFACTPVTKFAPMRPAKGATGTAGIPRYRNPNNFTASGGPNQTSCSATTTASGGTTTMYLSPQNTKRGIVMKGAPLTGEQIVTLSGTGPAGFFLKAAPATPVKAPGPTGFGLRRTTSGEFNNIPPYLYSYTYATLRNDAGSFLAGGGPGAFEVKYGGKARANVKAGANQFGGVMRLLGKITTKVCYYSNGGCNLGSNDWRYDAVGATAYTMAGVVSKGYKALYSAMYYHTALMTPNTVMGRGYRFPWTTGTATASGLDSPHISIQQRKGYDNRTPQGKGTIQLVTPVLTRWTQTGVSDQFTGGIGIMRLQFVPEPAKMLLLVGGIAALGFLYRMFGR